MKKLLILSGAAVHIHLVQTAKEMGLYTIVTDYLKPERAPAKLVADEYWMISITDTDRIVERCEKENVSAVINACIDPAQKPYAEICSRLNLPCYGSQHQFDILTNKRRFRKCCTKLGISIVKEYTYTECSNIDANFPVLVKPLDSRASRGQTICSNHNELSVAIDKAKSYSSSEDCIIEQYLGYLPEISFTAFILNGIPYFVRTADKFLGNCSGELQRPIKCVSSPSKYTNKIIKIAEKYITLLVKELGIKNGPIFLQGFWDGKDILLFDPAFRFHGSEYSKTLETATGINLMKYLIELSLGKNPAFHKEKLLSSYKLNGKRHAMFILYLTAGRVASIRGFSLLKKNKCIIDLRQKVFEGDTVTSSSGDYIDNRAADVSTLINDNFDSMNDISKTIYETIKMTDKTGNNMLIDQLSDEEIREYFAIGG